MFGMCCVSYVGFLFWGFCAVALILLFLRSLSIYMYIYIYLSADTYFLRCLRRCIGAVMSLCWSIRSHLFTLMCICTVIMWQYTCLYIYQHCFSTSCIKYTLFAYSLYFFHVTGIIHLGWSYTPEVLFTWHCILHILFTSLLMTCCVFLCLQVLDILVNLCVDTRACFALSPCITCLVMFSSLQHVFCILWAGPYASHSIFVFWYHCSNLMHALERFIHFCSVSDRRSSNLTNRSPSSIGRHH